MLAGALFGGLSHTRGELMGARVLLGIGTAFARTYKALYDSVYRLKRPEITACALVPELAHPRVRHMAGGFLNTTYFVSRA
jgi:hypothetical protein